LRANKSYAFKAKEIAKRTKMNENTVRSMLSNLIKDKLVLHKAPYFAYFLLKKKKMEKIMLGPKKCPEWLKHAYKKAVDYTCEDCGRKEGTKRKDGSIVKLEIHKIIQGYKGGTYRPGNCKVLCTECHKMYADEW